MPFSYPVYRLKVHKKGIIVLPKEVRERLNIREGDEVNAIVDDEGIYIFPKMTVDKIFGSDKGALEALKLLEEERRREREEGNP